MSGPTAAPTPARVAGARSRSGDRSAIGASTWTSGVPRVGLVLFLVVVAFVPVWCGFTVSYYFQPASLAGIAVAGVLALWLPRRLCIGDVLVAFFVVACLAPLVTGDATISSVFVVLSQWLVGFLVGRLATGSVSFEWICSAIAVVFTVVAVWAMVEFAFGWHAFVDFGPPNELHSVWGEIQDRGGVDRSEAAFGHSIALGVSLALAAPFVLGSRFRPWIRVAMCALLLGGVVVTFSRASLACCVLALVLTVLFVRDEHIVRVRTAILVLLGAVAAITVPLLLTVFAEAGKEAADSGAFRGRLIDLVPAIHVLGISSAVTHSPSGVLRIGGFKSVDNAVLMAGLTYGWIAVVVGLALLAIGVWVLLSGRGSVAVAAAVAQTPALFAVALITQYAVFFWFVVGLAVATSVRSSPADQRSAPPGSSSSSVRPPNERYLRAVQ